MSNIHNVIPCSDNSQDDLTEISLQKALKKVDMKISEFFDFIDKTVDPRKRLDFYIDTLAPLSECKSQHQQNLKLARIVSVTPQTIENWRNEITQCHKLKVFYIYIRDKIGSEYEIAVALGAYVGRDLLKEVGL